jgi:hypothetical protein
MTAVLLVLLSAHPAVAGRTCESCHPVHAGTFARSAHAHSFSNPLFQASWLHARRRPWCLTCHDPQGTRLGVGCQSCHEPLEVKTSPDTCARCHQFSAPEAQFAGVAMQDTVGEWRRSNTQETCASCHFKDADHLCAGGHDFELLRQTLRVTWSADCATVEAVRAGHAVPTGDPFHVLRLSSCADEGCATRLASRSLARRIEAQPDGHTALVGARGSARRA